MSYSIQKRESLLPLGMRMSQVISRNAYSQNHCNASNEPNDPFGNLRIVNVMHSATENPPSNIPFKKVKAAATVHVSPTSNQMSHTDLSKTYSNLLGHFKQKSQMTQRLLCGSLNKGRVTRKSSTYYQLHNLNKIKSNSQENLHNFVHLYGNIVAPENPRVNNRNVEHKSQTSVNDQDDDEASFYFTPNVENGSPVNSFELSSSPSYSPCGVEHDINISYYEKDNTADSSPPKNIGEVLSSCDGSPTSENYFANNNLVDFAPKLDGAKEFHSGSEEDQNSWYIMNNGDDELDSHDIEKINYSQWKNGSSLCGGSSTGDIFKDVDNYQRFEPSTAPLSISELLKSGSEVHFQHQFDQYEYDSLNDLQNQDERNINENDKDTILLPLVSFPKIDGTLVIEELPR